MWSRQFDRDVLLPVILVRGGYGLTLGLYLFVQAVVLQEAIAAPAADALAAVGGVALAEATGVAGLPVVVWGVAGYTARQWTLLMLGISVTLAALLEYPTGVLADLLGRKRSCVASFGFRAAFFGCMLAVPLHAGAGSAAYTWALVGRVAFAIGYALLSGALSAWVFDTLCDRLDDGTRSERELKDEASAAVMVVTGVGEFWYWAGLPAGAVAAIWLHHHGRVADVFLLGAALSAATALACLRLMREHRAGPRDRRGHGRGLRRDFVLLWRMGVRCFGRAPRLWAVAAAGTCLTVLIDLVDFYVLPIFRELFPAANALGPKVCVVLAVGLSGLAGSWLSLRVAGGWWRAAAPADYGPRLLRYNAWLYVLFAAPVFGIGLVVHLDLGWVTFLGLLIAHKFVEGALDAPQGTLNNYFIPNRQLTRASVLSLVSVFRKLGEAAVVFGVVIALNLRGTEAVDGWVAAAALVVAAAGLLFALAARVRRGRPGPPPPPAAVTPAAP